MRISSRIVKLLSLLTLCALLASMSGCGSSGGGAEEIKADATFSLDAAATGGFDDWGSPGAAFGYAVDETNGYLLVVGLKFSLPAYQVTFTEFGAATDYLVSDPPTPLEDDVVAYPLLGDAMLNTAGIRTMTLNATGVSAVLLKGAADGEGPPEALYIADEGQLMLTRGDGPGDTLEGALRFREVDKLGPGAKIVPGGEVIQVNAIYFSWPTDEQP